MSTLLDDRGLKCYAHLTGRSRSCDICDQLIKMVTSIVCKHVVLSANTTAAKKEFLVELALKYGHIRPLHKTRRVTPLLQGYCGGVVC